MSLGAKVAQSPNISCVTYGGNKEVCVCENTGVTIPEEKVENLPMHFFQSCF